MTKERRKIEFFNSKARFDYEILESLETGIELKGSEIKAIRSGRINLTGSYAKVINGEVFWIGGNLISEGLDNQRTRKLMLHREEIERLIGKSQQQGLSLIPLKLYLKHGRAKIELGIGKGKKKYDKRETLKKRDQEREISRNIKVR